MAVQELQRCNKRLPGPLPWKLEDGTTPEIARRQIIAYLVFTHDAEECCRLLRIGGGALEEIKRTPLAVSRDVGRRCALLRRVLWRNPARYFKIDRQLQDIERLQAAGRHSLEPPQAKIDLENVDMKTARGLNSVAARKMGEMIKAERERRGLTYTQVGEMLKIRRQCAYDIERSLSPRSKVFFKVIEFYGLDPDAAFFAGYCAMQIREWKKRTTKSY